MSLQRTNASVASLPLAFAAERQVVRQAGRAKDGTMKYPSGESVLAGDVVRVVFRSSLVEARVKAVLVPGSTEALEWNAPEGGIMVESEATGLVLWRTPDEDMDLVRRGS